MTPSNSKNREKESPQSGYCLARNTTYCTFCPGYCCYRLPGASLYLDGDDINRIARHFKISDGTVRARYLEGKNTFKVDADGACIFLSRKRIRARCTIHAARPRQCREFPYGKACPYLEGEELLEAILPKIEGWLVKKEVSVVCAVLIRDGLVFAAQRSSSMSMPRKWEFPGGKIEPGESPRECLHREIFEELGVRISICRQLPSNRHEYPHLAITLYPFVGTIVAGEIHLHEHAAAVWLAPDKLAGLDWAEADLPVLAAYRALALGGRESGP